MYFMLLLFAFLLDNKVVTFFFGEGKEYHVYVSPSGYTIDLKMISEWQYARNQKKIIILMSLAAVSSTVCFAECLPSTFL